MSKTDGVPLYVEELTKMLLESELLKEEADQYVLTGSLSEATIPATLQDSLMARLDRVPTVKEVAQLGAVLGREFAYEMLHALAVVEETALQEGLGQLVETELLYQRGRIPRAKYIFRHALIRDAAYESLLRRTRQHYHQQVAELLEVRFPEVVERQPELVAHHYTEAGCPEPAIAHWQRAGQRAYEHGANQEAVQHSSAGLEVLAALPETSARCDREFDLLTTLRPAMQVLKGTSATEVEPIVERMRVLSQQMEDTPKLDQVLQSLWPFYQGRGRHQVAREVSEQLLSLGERQPDISPLWRGQLWLGSSLFYLGELSEAREQLEQGLAGYDLDQHRLHSAGSIQNPAALALFRLSQTLWCLGYPDQALENSRDAMARADESSHGISQTSATRVVGMVYLLRREVSQTRELAEATLALTSEHGYANELGLGTVLYGWALVAQGQVQEGLDQLHAGLDALKAIRLERELTANLAYLADAYGIAGQPEDGLRVLGEALGVVEQNGERFFEAALYRLKGELLLKQGTPDATQAESCFQQALDIARQQQAKSLELRAATSLARLWWEQDERQNAYDLLAPVYGWFTEGFDTADLIEAKSLLNELSAEVKPSTA